MEIDDENPIESPQNDPSTDDQGQGQQSEATRKQKRAVAHDVGKLKVQLKLLHDENERLKAEMDDYRQKSQSYIDQIRENLSIRQRTATS